MDCLYIFMNLGGDFLGFVNGFLVCLLDGLLMEFCYAF